MVLRGEIPDRVPVMPGYGTWYASRVLGVSLFDMAEGKASPSDMIVELNKRYGCEFWYWTGYGDSIAQTGSNGVGEFSVVRTDVDEDNYVETVTMKCPGGELSQDMLHSRWNPAQYTSGWIKDPERDWPIYRQGIGDEWQWGDYTSLADIPQDALDWGVTTFGVCLPVDFWKGMRCDTASAIMDLFDEIPVMEQAMEWHTEYSLQMLAARMAIRPLPDMIHLQGSSSSLSMISPDIYLKYNVDFINKACALAHAENVPVQIHHCGKSNKLVEILYNMTEVDCIHPLEPTPGGDVDLKDVKKRFGHRIILMGNINTFSVMRYGTPQQVRETVRQAIDDAAEGGRFILANGDQLGGDTPEENVIAMVEAAHEFGQYS